MNLKPLLTISSVFVIAGSLLLSNSAAQAAQPIIVNSTVDEPDTAPGDGACSSTPSGFCTLRAAVMDANAAFGDDTIILPASPMPTS